MTMTATGTEIMDAREQARQREIDDTRKNAAFNALTKIYGDVAGDPEDALKAQSYQYNNSLNPLLLQHQQNVNTGEDLSNQKAGAELPYVGPKAAADVDETQARTALYGSQTRAQDAATPFVAAEKQATIASTNAGTADTQAQTQTRQLQLRAGEGDVNRAQLTSVLTAISNTAATGGDLGAAFDKYAPVISDFTGGDPTKLADWRRRITTDPQHAIPDLQSAIMAGNMLLPGKGKGGAAVSPLQQRASQISAMEVIAERTKAVPGTIQQAVSLLPKMSGSAVLRKAREHIPGTPEYQFDQLAMSIKSNLSLDDLRSLRTSGLSLGRTNIAEFTASANAFANIDLGQDPRTVAQALQRLGGTYGRVNENLHDDIARMKVGIPGSMFGAQPAAKPAGQKQTGGVPSPAALDAMIQKAGGIDNAIGHASTDGLARALADRYSATHGPGAKQVPKGKPAASIDDLLNKYGGQR